MRHGLSQLAAALLLLYLLSAYLPASVASDALSRSTVVQHEYIVMFKEFSSQDMHEGILENVLVGVKRTSWQLLQRKNNASRLPSDFALLKLSGSEQEEILLELLRKSDEVKYVVEQRQYHDPLSSFVMAEDSHRVHNTVGLLFDMEQEQSLRNSSMCKDHDGLAAAAAAGRNSADIPTFDFGGAFGTGRRLQSTGYQVTNELNAEFLWDKMHTGAGVKVAVFDTGLGANHPHFRNVKERTDWTDEGTLEDYVGHGTFVAGVIAGQDRECPGFAPNSELYIFRVFTNARVSFTSWFLDAFNYAIHSKVDVLNLSIGGPDFMDKPFVEKVWELSANNIIVISAIGNDGPVYGTLNNPADMLDVIGVGGVDFFDKVASFSSRGMTTWELPEGYGRVKPDVMAFGQSVVGSRPHEGCRTLSGTSVASPVVAGAVALLVSTVPELYRSDVVNPASIKQVLIETAELVGDANIFEQGYGRVNLVGAYEALAAYTPRASVLPSSLDLTDCPYMWPYCSQPLYHTAMPVVVNTTVLNGMGVAGSFFGEPQWLPGKNGHLLEVSFTYSEILWPWSGYLALHIRVAEEAAEFDGEVEGLVQFVVVSPPSIGEDRPRFTNLQLPVKAKVIPTPPRHRRILWDQFHSLNYPPGFLPSDVLWDKADPFDWNGDHIHTNFRALYSKLRSLHYFVEVLSTPFTCFEADNYLALLVVDSEEEFFEEEAAKLMDDMQERGLSLLVLGDWYNEEIMESVRFFDENTNKWWSPETGGSNLPALNELLAPLGVSLSRRVYSGDFSIGGRKTKYASGASIARFPAGGHLASMGLRDQVAELLTHKDVRRDVPVIGLLDIMKRNGKGSDSGLVVMGDSSCFDDSPRTTSCIYLMEDFLQFIEKGEISQRLSTRTTKLTTDHNDGEELPVRAEGNELFTLHSKVLGPRGPWFASCPSVTFAAAGPSGDPVEITWEPRVYVSRDRRTGNRASDDGVVQLLEDNLRAYVVPYSILCFSLIALVAYVVVRKDASSRRPRGHVRRYSKDDSV